MSSLIDRLENAREGSRDLDAEINLAVFSQVALPEPPHYTTSIDAALTALPEGWQWKVSNRAPKPHTGRAYIHNGELHFAGLGAAPNPRFRGYETTAATPALALITAILKALTTEKEG